MKPMASARSRWLPPAAARTVRASGIAATAAQATVAATQATDAFRACPEIAGTDPA
jgi:hypothetical protein